MTQKIVCAANRCGDLVIIGIRHFDTIMRRQIELFECLVKQRLNESQWEQGFIDNRGQFFNRRDSFKIAMKANQINFERNGSDKELYSEGLY